MMIQRVVDNGKCNDEATNIVIDDKSATFSNFLIMFPPTVLIIFHPPTAVPDIAVAQATLPIIPAQRLLDLEY